MGWWVDTRVAEGRFSERYFSFLMRESIKFSDTNEAA
jgi:hypothetical protein